MTVTFELGHESTRNGIVVQVDGISSQHEARAVASDALELAGGWPTPPPVCDPGWWAIVVGWAATRWGDSSVQRTIQRSHTHVRFRVERCRMLELRPDWPMVQLRDGGPWLDLRSEAALRRGPSDSELLEYAKRMPEPTILGQKKLTVAELARMFEVGVLEWEPGDVKPNRRRGIRAAR